MEAGGVSILPSRRLRAVLVGVNFANQRVKSALNRPVFCLALTSGGLPTAGLVSAPRRAGMNLAIFIVPTVDPSGSVSV